MNWYDLAAACFLTLIILKFVVGAFAERFDLAFEPDAFHEVLFCTFFVGMARFLDSDIDRASLPLAASAAYFAITLWSAISIHKAATLMNLGGGRRR